MRHLLYDDSGDKALIAQLQITSKEKSDLIAKLLADNEALRKQVLELLTTPVKTATPQKMLTKEDVATKLGLPLWAVDQIDWGRIGAQFKDLDLGKK